MSKKDFDCLKLPIGPRNTTMQGICIAFSSSPKSSFSFPLVEFYFIFSFFRLLTIADTTVQSSDPKVAQKRVSLSYFIWVPCSVKGSMFSRLPQDKNNLVHSCTAFKERRPFRSVKRRVQPLLYAL